MIIDFLIIGVAISLAWNAGMTIFLLQKNWETEGMKKKLNRNFDTINHDLLVLDKRTKRS